MKRGTLFLKIAVMVMAIPAFAFIIFGVPWLIKNPVDPDYAHVLYPIVIGIFISVVPFLMVLYLAFKLLGYIDKEKAFTELSTVALRKIKYCAFIICLIYIAILPFVYLLAQIDDAPGLIIVGIVPAFASLVVAVFAAVLKRIFDEAIRIKEENDLTV